MSTGFVKSARRAVLLVMAAAICTAAARVPAESEKNASKPATDKKDASKSTTAPNGLNKGNGGSIPDPKQVGGEPESIVQVANLVYAGVKSSHCFSDHFLVAAEKESTISTSRRFHAVKLSSDEMFNYPLVIMTGEGSFILSQAERENLRSYIDRGGFLLASAGCSSQEWNQSFRREMAAVFPDIPLQPIGMTHPIFNTIYEIKELKAKHGTPRPLEGVILQGRLGVVYSQDGLNDTAHTQGCCCCGGNEIANCLQINVNVLAYALIY